MSGTVTTRISVRVYELDSFGHVNGAVYLQYAEHVGWECFRSAGITESVLREHGLAPVRLEETVRYIDELRAGDEVEVTTIPKWGAGKVFRAVKEFRRDGVVVAEVTSVGGVLDMKTRRLVSDPVKRLREMATSPEAIGLAGTEQVVPETAGA